MSRLQFLQLVTAAAGALFLVDKVGLPALRALEEQERAIWDENNISNEDFRVNHKMEFANMELATTFIPSGSLQGMKTADGQLAFERDKQIITTVVEDFGMRNIRIGIRLTNVIDSNGKFTFDYYRWLFDYLAEQKVSMTVNVGIKSNGYPETFIPAIFKRNKDSLPKSDVITLGDEIAKRSLDCIDQICTTLEKYSKFITTVQPSNEAFDNFGPDGRTVGEDLLLAETERLVEHIPNASVLVNGNIWNFLARGKAPDALAKMKARGIQNVILGIDHYPFVPQLFDIRILPMAFRRLDPALLARNLPFFSLMNDISRVHAMGGEHEFTEINMKPYGDATGWDDEEPGNSAIGFRHAIAGAMRLTPNMDSLILPKKIRFSAWTAGHVAEAVIDKRSTPNQQEIVEMIKMITG